MNVECPLFASMHFTSINYVYYDNWSAGVTCQNKFKNNSDTALDATMVARKLLIPLTFVQHTIYMVS